MNDQQQPQPSASNGRRKWIIIFAIALLALGVFGYWLTTRGKVTTDDAQINGDLVPISPRINGYVDAVAVHDNQLVDAGQLLVQLDRRDLEAKLTAAGADLSAAKAQFAAATGQVALIERTAPAGASQAGAGVIAAGAGVSASISGISAAQSQVKAADAGVQVARAGVTAAKSDVTSADAQVRSATATLAVSRENVNSAEAQATKVVADLGRLKQLFGQGAISRQTLDAGEAANTSAQSALSAAKDGVNVAKAVLDQAKAGRANKAAALRQADSKLKAAIAAASQARQGVASAKAQLQQAHGQLGQAQAGKAGAETVPQQLTISKAQNKAAFARIQQAQAALRNAKLQLSYTRITAPVTGVVSQKGVQLGQYVQSGQLLMAIVPLSNVWVTANFKENDIEQMRTGQRVTIDVDTYPGRDFTGKVQSMSAATGSKFSLLPPENATGNFVKVVQRIPVKIVLDQPIPKDVILRPGQNVTATVHL